MQWNAVGITTKIIEVRERLKEDKIDSCNIQETKLTPQKSTLKISGCKAVMPADRKGGIQGGGLITYILNPNI